MRPVVDSATLLLHPAVLVAMLVLGLNDHWGKQVAPGIITGKLSDCAGLAFFPVLLAVGVSGISRRPLRFRGLVAAVFATAGVFVAIKVHPGATGAYQDVLAFLQWPLQATGILREGRPFARTDPTDLVALPFLLVPLWIGRNLGRVTVAR